MFLHLEVVFVFGSAHVYPGELGEPGDDVLPDVPEPGPDRREDAAIAGRRGIDLKRRKKNIILIAFSGERTRESDLFPPPPSGGGGGHLTAGNN